MSKPQFLKIRMLFVTLLLLQAGAFAQLKTITGVVKDDKGAPLAKASVTAKGANQGVATKNDGTFSISVPESTTILIVSSSEFETRQVDIKTSATVEVVLIAAIKKLDDVIVNVGYGTQKAKDVTGAITQIKGEAIKNLPTQDVATALQGRVAGVDVIQGTGEPGTTSQITIRGVSSLNQPNPLYIIDGVQQPGGNNVNPQDVETITVLKDASAAAIYGAAAAGGVILITTKKGKGEKPTINLNARYGVSTPRLIKLLHKDEFVRYQKETDYGTYDAASQSYIDSLPDFDWQKAIYGNGIEQNYNLSISGATPNVNYFVSGVYNNQKGVYLDNSSSMYGARINTEFKISNSVKIGEQINVWKRVTNPVKTNVLTTPFRTIPIGSPYSTTPGVPWGIFPFGYSGTNIVAQIKSADFEFPETMFQGNAYLEIRLPIKYMTFRNTVGFTSQSYQNNLFQSNIVPSSGSIQGNHLYRSIGNYTQVLNAATLAYDHTWGQHTLNLLVGYELYQNKTNTLTTDVTGVLGTSYGYLESSTSGRYVVGKYDPNGLVKSTFGRINYDLSKKYIITFTARRDGNFTTFGPDKQYGVFPAISAGWNVDKEIFFKKIRNVVNQLKIRGSYGELGNSAIPGYLFVNTYNVHSRQNFAPGSGIPGSSGTGEIGYTQEGFANTNIHWESTRETNVGLDGQLLNGKIYFTLDWYSKTTKDLLYKVPVPLSSGIPPTGDPVSSVVSGSVFENVGSVKNTGFDIGLGYDNKIGKLNYSVNFIGSFNKNKVVELNTIPIKDGDNNYPATGASSVNPWNGYNLTYTVPGLSFGQFYGLRSLGIIANEEQLGKASIAQPNAQIGDLMFEDVNHDNQINADDLTVIGNPYPKFTYGINIGANWKSWDIALLFNGVMGADIYNGVTPFEFISGDGGNVTSKAFKASMFRHDDGSVNGITEYPAIGHYSPSGKFQQDPNGNYRGLPNSFFVENGAYLKLKNLQLGYTISDKLLRRVKIKSARLYVMANNVFTITKYSGIDPEIGSLFSQLSSETVVTDAKKTGVRASGVSAANAGVTNRGLDVVGKYPSVRLFQMGIDLKF